MPVSFFIKSERERLKSVPKEISFEYITAFFTLSEADLVFVKKQHSDYNLLWFALQLWLLRYLGFSPQDIISLLENLVAYVASQLNVTTIDLVKYGKRNPTRTVDFQAIQAYLGFRKATTDDLHTFSRWLLDWALEHDKPSLLLQLLCEKLYKEKIVRPGITRLEKLVATARSQAQEETFKRISPLLKPDRKKFLDDLLVINEKINRTIHALLIKCATSNTESIIFFCLDKLALLRNQEIDTWDMSLLTTKRLKFLSQIAKRSTNQALQRITEEKRYQILLAFFTKSFIEIIDETIEIFDQCLWDCYNGAKNYMEAFKKEVYKSSNEKVRILQ